MPPPLPGACFCYAPLTTTVEGQTKRLYEYATRILNHLLDSDRATGDVIMDIDDTILTDPQGKIIRPALLFYDAFKDRVPIHFVTARHKSMEKATVDQLKNNGFSKYATLTFYQGQYSYHKYKDTAANASYKPARGRGTDIVSKRILMRIGDQAHDVLPHPPPAHLKQLLLPTRTHGCVFQHKSIWCVLLPVRST